MKKRIVVILFLLLAAAGIGIFALAQSAPLVTRAPSTDTSLPPITESDASRQCYYNWAYQDLPEISAELQSAVQAVISEAEAHATAFGEDCIYEDGSATFTAMETDFYIILSVSDLGDGEFLGNFIEQVLAIVDRLTPPRVPGPKEGFIEFTFRNGENQRVLRVPLPLGRELRERGLHGTDLLQAIEAQ